MVTIRTLGVHIIVFALTVFFTQSSCIADAVYIPNVSLPLCGIRQKSDASNKISLRQYLSHFSLSDLDEESSRAALDYVGMPCMRPAIKNTSVILVDRVVELGYAEWDPDSGMLDLDVWIHSWTVSSLTKQVEATSSVAVSSSKSPQSRRALVIPWKNIVAGLILFSVVLLLLMMLRISSVTMARISIASLHPDASRTKIRGIAIPINGALSPKSTDIHAVAYNRITSKYTHKGWQTLEKVSDQTPCTIDDGTGCVDVDFTHATVHCNNTIKLYNDIPGEPIGRTPYVDDTNAIIRYIPVGAVITIIGTLVPTESGFRAANNVHVFAGDERRYIRSLRIRLACCIGVLLVLCLSMFVLLTRG